MSTSLARSIAPVGPWATRAPSVSMDNTPAIADMLAAAISGRSAEPNRSQAGLSVAEQVQAFRHWVFVCVRAIQNSVCKVPLRVMDITRTDEPVEITDEDDPLVNLFRYPNPWDTDVDFWSWIVMFLELTGNACLLKVRDNLGVAELWPVPSQWIRPVHKPGRPLVGYMLDDGLGGGVLVPANDIVHLQYRNPNDRFWGLGTLSAAAQAAGAVDAVKKSQTRSFEEEILQDMAFVTDTNLDGPAFERMRAQIVERYGGASKKGLPLLLEGGVKVEHFNRPAAEMAYQETSITLRDEILAVFQVPPLYAGIVDSANKSNAQEQTYALQAVCVEPRLRIIQARLNRDPELVPKGRMLVFDSPVPRDAEKATGRLVKLTASGAIAPNELRSEEGYEPVPWGEYPKWVWDLMISNGLEELSPAAIKAAADKAAAVPVMLPPAQDQNQPADQGQSNDQVPPGDAKNQNDQQAGRAATAVSGSPEHLHRGQSFRRSTRSLAEKKNLIRRIEREQEEVVADLTKVLRRFFAQQQDRILANIPRVFSDLSERCWDELFVPVVVNVNGERLFADGSTQRFAIDRGFAVSRGSVDSPSCWCGNAEWQKVSVRALNPNLTGKLDDWFRAAKELYARMKDHIAAAVGLGAKMQEEQVLSVAGRFDLQSPSALAFMEKKQRFYWDGAVNSTTQQLLSEKLGEVMAEGPTQKKLAAAVKEVFEGDPEGRPRDVIGGRFASAKTIARTETAGAYNGGAQMVRDDLGVSEKEWMATFDDRTRSTHEAADGQVRKNGEAFDVGLAKLMFPGDPDGPVSEIANCRCACVGLASIDDGLVPDGTPVQSTPTKPKPKPKPAEKPAGDGGVLLLPSGKSVPRNSATDDSTPDVLPRSFSDLEVVRSLGNRATLVKDKAGRQFVLTVGLPNGVAENRALALNTIRAAVDAGDKESASAAAAGVYRYANGEPMLLTEFIDGVSLDSVLHGSDKNAFISAREQIAKTFGADVAVGNYRVIDSDNIVIDKTGRLFRVKAAGFGMSVDGSPEKYDGHPVELFYGARNTKTWMDESLAMMLRPRYGSPFLDLADRLPDVPGAGPLYKQRVDAMKEIRASMKAMEADKFFTEWREMVSYHRLAMRRAGVLDVAANKLTMAENPTFQDMLHIADENGKWFDNLRGSSSDSVQKRYREYLGRERASLIDLWGDKQAESSWNDLPMAMKHLFASARDVDDKKYFWSGNDLKSRLLNLKEIEDDTEFSQKEMFDTLMIQQAFTQELLGKIDMPNNDRERRVLKVFRTEDSRVLEKQGVNDVDAAVITRGPAESASMFAPVFIYGDTMTATTVPHHRVLGTFLQGRGEAMGDKNSGSLFADNSENEVIVMLEGLKSLIAKPRDEKPWFLKPSVWP